MRRRGQWAQASSRHDRQRRFQMRRQLTAVITTCSVTMPTGQSNSTHRRRCSGTVASGEAPVSSRPTIKYAITRSRKRHKRLGLSAAAETVLRSGLTAEHHTAQARPWNQRKVAAGAAISLTVRQTRLGARARSGVGSPLRHSRWRARRPHSRSRRLDASQPVATRRSMRLTSGGIGAELVDQQRSVLLGTYAAHRLPTGPRSERIDSRRAVPVRGIGRP